MEDTVLEDITGGHWENQGPPSDFSDAIFARRLREIRLQAKLTQQQLADRMTKTGHKMHRSAIAKIEVGDRPVSIGEAVQFAGALDVPLMELVSDRHSDTEQEKLHRARIEAQVAVRSLRHEAAERQKLLDEAKILLDNTVDRLQAAHRRLEELGGGVAWDTPNIEQSLAELSTAAHAPLDDPAAVARMLGSLREAGADQQVTALLNRDPAGHVALDDAAAVARLLGSLREAGADQQVDILAGRAAAHAPLDDAAAVARLLGSLREAGADQQVDILAGRAAAHAPLDDPDAVTRLLGSLREAAGSSEVTAFTARLAAAGMSDLLHEIAGLRFSFGREPR